MLITSQELRDWVTEIEDAITGASGVHAGIEATLQDMRARADKYDEEMKDQFTMPMPKQSLSICARCGGFRGLNHICDL